MTVEPNQPTSGTFRDKSNDAEPPSTRARRKLEREHMQLGLRDMYELFKQMEGILSRADISPDVERVALRNCVWAGLYRTDPASIPKGD